MQPTFLLVFLLAAPPATAPPPVLTPDAAYALVVRAPLSRTALPKPDQVAASRKVLEAQAARDPKAAKWAYALAHVAYGRQRGSEALAYIDQAIHTAENSNEHDLVSSLSDTRRAWAS